MITNKQSLELVQKLSTIFNNVSEVVFAENNIDSKADINSILLAAHCVSIGAIIANLKSSLGLNEAHVHNLSVDVKKHIDTSIKDFIFILDQIEGDKE